MTSGQKYYQGDRKYFFHHHIHLIYLSQIIVLIEISAHSDAPRKEQGRQY